MRAWTKLLAELACIALFVALVCTGIAVIAAPDSIYITEYQEE